MWFGTCLLIIPTARQSSETITWDNGTTISLLFLPRVLLKICSPLRYLEPLDYISMYPSTITRNKIATALLTLKVGSISLRVLLGRVGRQDLDCVSIGETTHLLLVLYDSSAKDGVNRESSPSFGEFRLWNEVARKWIFYGFEPFYGNQPVCDSFPL